MVNILDNYDYHYLKNLVTLIISELRRVLVTDRRVQHSAADISHSIHVICI